MKDVLELFNCIIIGEDQLRGQHCLTHVDIGVVTDFNPNALQDTILTTHFKPLNLHTFFTREEREKLPVEHLLMKQVLHYIEVYGLGLPGLFNLSTSQGELISMCFVQGISVEALDVMVQNLLYANAPIKDTEQIVRIVKEYDLTFDINRVVNNELRVRLWDSDHDSFTSGDDAVRFLCYKATGETLLIKSPEVISAVSKVDISNGFLIRHMLPLAQVFNRHKRLILAVKGPGTRTTINRIARLSKTRHVPIPGSIAKIFISHALTHPTFSGEDWLSRAPLRDKFKYLNLLEQKKLQSPVASFKIRNGKVHTSIDRPVYAFADISRVEQKVLDSLAKDLNRLRDQNILLDKSVDYGLPISRKQTVGNLPFGTRVTSDSNEISSGMYWENDWGASDLDLSTIDLDGNRVGWGMYSGYTDKDITFSGDLTDARNGAMEFMTSKVMDYGLFVNIYAGEVGAEMELVIGANSQTRSHWIEEVLIREKHILRSRNSVIGFVKGKTFVVYAGRLSNSRISGANPIINESKMDFWTLQKLFSVLNINFDVDKQDGIVYDHDLSYSSFSFDKLEAVFKAT